MQNETKTTRITRCCNCSNMKSRLVFCLYEVGQVGHFSVFRLKRLIRNIWRLLEPPPTRGSRGCDSLCCWRSFLQSLGDAETIISASRPRHALPQLVTVWFCHTSQTLHPGWVSEEDDGGRTLALSHIHRSYFLYRCLVWWHDSEGLMGLLVKLRTFGHFWQTCWERIIL